MSGLVVGKGIFEECDGARVIIGMKADLDRLAAAMNLTPLSYYVDSGRLDGTPTCRYALLRLVRGARDGLFGAVLVLDRRAFADDETMAADVLEALERAGVSVIQVARLPVGEPRDPALTFGDAS